jgi:secreted Zn-dependent insulinase-like peptidase
MFKMNYDVTAASIADKIKKVVKPCSCCGESLDIRLHFENDVLGWMLRISCPNCCTPVMDKRFLKTIGEVEVELSRLLNTCE